MPDEIDKQIGNTLRIYRKVLGFSQASLAEKVGVTFQQIQKYENGKNRISASLLYRFSKILNMHVSRFFKDIEKDSMPSLAEAVQQEMNELVVLVQAYQEIQPPEYRHTIAQIILEIADHQKNVKKAEG